MDGVRVREIIKRDAKLTVDDRYEIRVDFFGRAHVLARAYDEIDAGAHRPDQAERRDETEPIPTVLGFLIKHVRAEDAVGLPLPLAGDLRALIGVFHGMVGPLHQVVPIVAVELGPVDIPDMLRSEEHTSELQSLMRISYAVFCLQK